MKYESVYSAPCSLVAEEKSCWEKIKKDTGLTNAKAPDCTKAYKESAQGYENQTTDEFNKVPSVVFYAVNIILENRHNTITLLSGNIECHPSD